MTRRPKADPVPKPEPYRREVHQIGYARVSSADQDLTVQIEALKADGCLKVFCEKRSGKTTDGRIELQRAIEACDQPGDVLVIYRLDRMARSLTDLLAIMAYLDEHEIGLKCLTQPIDTTSTLGRFMTTILGAVAEFENALRRDRQMDGIALARRKGVYRREKKFDAKQIRHMRYVRRFTPAMISRQLGCCEATVHRIAPGRARAPVAALKASSNPPSSRLSARAQ